MMIPTFTQTLILALLYFLAAVCLYKVDKFFAVMSFACFLVSVYCVYLSRPD